MNLSYDHSAQFLEDLYTRMQGKIDKLCLEYNLNPIRLSFKNDKLQTSTGRVILGQALLGIRVLFIRPRQNIKEMEETLAHEMAHFIAYDLYRDYGHGAIWKRHARALGAFPRARIGHIEQETAKSQRISNAKSQRARNRKEHPSHTEYNADCHLCRREL